MVHMYSFMVLLSIFRMPYIVQLKAEPSHRIYRTDQTVYINRLYYTGHFFTMQWLDVQQVASQLQSNYDTCSAVLSPTLKRYSVD